MTINNPSNWRRIMLLGFVALLASCASTPPVISNAAPDFDLTRYSTFSFLQPLSTDNGNVRTIISNELITPAKRELEWKGMRHVESGGDLLVNFVVSTRETIQTRSRPPTGTSVYYRAGRYQPWGGYSMAVSTTEVVQRTEGTLAIDLIDAGRRQLVWEGAISGRVTSKTINNRAAALDAGVVEILSKLQ